MRKFLIAVLLALTIGGMLVPASALAKRVSVFGSLAIAKCTDGACTSTTGLTTEFNGIAVIANPGLEKTITFQIPPFTFPIFANKERSDPGDSDLDTILCLVNVSGSSQTIRLTLRDMDGNPVALTTDTFTVDVNHTLSLLLSDLLP
ncbi:MAG: hypothetical protein KGL31_04620 [candidate division NC10 bacterium]|nr:hypothetical protein [candidate division NC10 bacterium]MDE2321186.1 hypothetical protein [candidate division NC10 bacterium]